VRHAELDVLLLEDDISVSRFTHPLTRLLTGPVALTRASARTHAHSLFFTRVIYSSAGTVPGLTNRATLDAYRLEPARVGLVTVNPARVRVSQGQIKVSENVDCL
jgi:hypothetical protein